MLPLHSSSFTWGMCQTSCDQIRAGEIVKSKVFLYHTAEEVSSKCQNNQLEGEKFADIDSFLGLHEAK